MFEVMTVERTVSTTGSVEAVVHVCMVREDRLDTYIAELREAMERLVKARSIHAYTVIPNRLDAPEQPYMPDTSIVRVPAQREV